MIVYSQIENALDADYSRSFADFVRLVLLIFLALVYGSAAKPVVVTSRCDARIASMRTIISRKNARTVYTLRKHRRARHSTRAKGGGNYYSLSLSLTYRETIRHWSREKPRNSNSNSDYPRREQRRRGLRSARSGSRRVVLAAASPRGLLRDSRSAAAPRKVRGARAFSESRRSSSHDRSLTIVRASSRDRFSLSLSSSFFRSQSRNNAACSTRTRRERRRPRSRRKKRITDNDDEGANASERASARAFLLVALSVIAVSPEERAFPRAVARNEHTLPTTT